MSLVERAIANLTDEHQLTPGLDVIKRQGNYCGLASGVEMSMVALFADLVARSPKVAAHGLDYHQLFYLPSLKAEHKVGYDLSIGRYNDEPRIRTMHKVVDEWCDTSWHWSIAPMRNQRAQLNAPRSLRHYQLGYSPAGDYRHLLTLIGSFADQPNLHPYLVLHVCRCIHDYRRMGHAVVDHMTQWRIPGPDSPLRTLIIDLSPLRTIGRWPQLLSRPDFRLDVHREAPAYQRGETAESYLSRLANLALIHITLNPGSINLPACVLNLATFCNRVAAIL